MPFYKETWKVIGIAGILVVPAVLSAELASTGARESLWRWGFLPPPVGTAEEEPDAGSWRTWFIESGEAIKVKPPPSMRETRKELAELERLRAKRTMDSMEIARKWDDGPANKPWVAVSLAALDPNEEHPPLAARNLAIVDLAIYDAIVSTWHWKHEYERAGPGEFDPTLPAFDPRANPSYPSEHAAVAGAASRVLAWLYPDEAERFEALAEEAARSRVQAGLNFPSDVKAGLKLGRAVAERAIAARANDGAEEGGREWTGSIPKGPCKWVPTPFNFTGPWGVLWPNVKPFLIERADQFRAPPPLKCDSPEYLAAHRRVFEQSQNVREMDRDWAIWWHDHDDLAVAGIFAPLVMDWVVADKLSSPRSARAFALLHAGMADAFLSIWDSKYAYWTERPVNVIRRNWDPDWLPLIETPSFPGYPSGHAGMGGVAGEILAHLFPERAVVALRWGYDEARAREIAGVHPDFDDIVGFEQGRDVAGVFIKRAMNDGAE